jgi:3-methyladenine DNA glycosylase Mpg
MQLADIASGTRIGISKGIDLQRRFGLRGSPFLSKKIPD